MHLSPFERTFVLVVILAFLMLTPPAGIASIAENYGYGARAIGMGGAFVGLADDFSAIFYNPAGLAQISGHRVAFGYLLGLPSLHIEELHASEDHEVDSKLHAPYIAVATDLTRALDLGRRLVFGLAGAFPGNFKNAYKARYGTDFDPYLPIFGAGHEDQRICLWFGPAIEVFPWLYVGGGCAFIVHGEEVDIRIAVDALTGEVEEEGTRVSMHVSTEIAPLAGLLVKPHDRITIGAAWRKEVAFEAPQQRAAMSVILPSGIEVPVEIVLPIYGHYTPAQYALGLSWRPLDRLLLAADVTYADWSGYKLNDGTPLDPPMRDRWIPRIGAELGVGDGLKVRAGYAYLASPLPRQRPGFEVNLADSTRHVFSFGSGYALEWPAAFSHPLGIEAFVQVQYLEPRIFPNVNPGGPDLQSHGTIIAVGAQLEFRF